MILPFDLIVSIAFSIFCFLIHVIGSFCEASTISNVFELRTTLTFWVLRRKKKNN
ncbi:hypothetical protein Scep_007301 [Stephania cephalantha]|uniref:Uncharacterized protein n=1 Tax=Stephania cephalantha TaxID=152367 RepID=A0AAP0KBB6_9MAGN